MRVPPHDADAERDIVGALLLRPDLLADVQDAGLVAGAFFSPKWGSAFAAIAGLARRGAAIDRHTVATALDTAAGPDPAEIVDAMADLPSPANVVTYARTVAGCAHLRRIIRACSEIVEAAYGPEAREDPGAFADWAEQAVFEATAESGNREAPALLVEAVADALDELRARASGELRGMPTGLADLDGMTGGLRPGQLIVVGARPSVGKSALVFGMAQRAAEQVGPALVFSAEMGRVELGTRALAGGGVASGRLLSGQLDPVDFKRLEARQAQLAAIPLLIDDAPGITIGAIRTRVRRQASRGGLALIVVDYVQLVGADSRKERTRAGSRRGVAGDSKPSPASCRCR